MATLPWSPDTLPRASAICPEGTATTTTSASVASPPSRPTAVTAWPARSQRRASPPPTLPLPSTKIFTLPPRRWPHRAAELIPIAPSVAAAQAGEDPSTTLPTAWSGHLGVSTPGRHRPGGGDRQAADRLMHQRSPSRLAKGPLGDRLQWRPIRIRGWWFSARRDRRRLSGLAQWRR